MKIYQQHQTHKEDNKIKYIQKKIRGGNFIQNKKGEAHQLASIRFPHSQ